MDAFEMHERGWPSSETIIPPGMPESEEYHWRSVGEAHINDPSVIADLQDAVRKNQCAYDAYANNANEQTRAVHLRGTRTPLRSRSSRSSPGTKSSAGFRRFVTGAMSYGSISMEAHSTLAIAIDRLGGKSNEGEGGEDAERSQPLPNGDTMRPATSRSRQVDSGSLPTTSRTRTSYRSRWPRVPSLVRAVSFLDTRCRRPSRVLGTRQLVSVLFRLSPTTISTRSRT